jgi:hypothetical protein
MLHAESDHHTLLLPERTLGENAAKPQFWEINTPGQDLGRAWHGTAVRRIGKRVINFVAESASYDAGYNVFKDENLPAENYPSEIFNGVHSRPAAIRRMNDYDQRQRDLTAQSQRPVMNFILHLGGFALDGAALSPIPIIGGLGHRLGTTLASGVENSILSGMVRCSTAAMLDTAEVELARIMADDYETLGENAESIALNVALAGLLGSAIGGLGGKVRSKAKADFADTILEGAEKFKKDVETATSLEGSEPRFPAGEIPTAADVVGDFSHLENDKSVVAQEFLRKVAVSDVVRASTSSCPVTRNFAMAVADSRSLRVGDAATIQAAELVIRTDSNRVINRVGKVIKNSLRKCRRDNRPEFSKIGESDFYGEISDALANGDISSNPYAEECARSLRPEIDKMWELWKEADLGGRRKHHMEVHGARVAELERELKKLEKAKLKETDANGYKRWERKVANSQEKLQRARAELERVTRGELTDREWGRISNDPSYITRIWDVRAISERTLGTVIPNLIKFFGSKKFREGMHDDLRSLGLFVDCTFSESTGRMADAYLDPTLSSRLARGARGLSNFSHKWTGAEAVLGAVHHVAAHSLCLHIGNLVGKIKLGEALTKDELHFCNISRLTPERLKTIGQQIEKFGISEDGLKLWNLEDWTDPVAKKDAIYAVNQMLDLCASNPSFEPPKFRPIGKISRLHGFPPRPMANWQKIC